MIIFRKISANEGRCKIHSSKKKEKKLRNAGWSVFLYFLSFLYAVAYLDCLMITPVLQFASEMSIQVERKQNFILICCITMVSFNSAVIKIFLFFSFLTFYFSLSCSSKMAGTKNVQYKLGNIFTDVSNKLFKNICCKSRKDKPIITSWTHYGSQF